VNVFYSGFLVFWLALRMRIFYVFFSLVASVVLMPALALAIINAEDLDLSKPEDGVVGKLGFSLSGSSGNSDKVSGEASGRVVWRHAQTMDMLVGSFKYGKSRGVRDTNASFIHLRHRYAWDDQWAWEAFTQAQKDEFARLKLRALIGGGMRWSYLDHGFDAHIGLGSFYEHEALRAIGNTSPITRAWRGNAYLALHYRFNERVRVQSTLYYQPSWQDAADYRLLDDAALHVALSDQLDLKLVLELSQDSRPPAGVQSTDMSYKTGLSYRF